MRTDLRLALKGIESSLMKEMVFLASLMKRMICNVPLTFSLFHPFLNRDSIVLFSDVLFGFL